MFQYILKRVLIFIPTLFIISLMIFGLSKLAPGDPVELLLKGGTNAGNTGQSANLIAGERAYQEKARELGLDKPTFYFAITSAAYPKEFYKITKQTHRETLSRLLDQTGNATAVFAYYEALKKFEFECADIGEGANYDVRRSVRDAVNELYIKYQQKDIENELANIRNVLPKDSLFSAQMGNFEQVDAAYKFLLANPTPSALYIPSIHWYGAANQYHTWMFGDYPWLSSVDSTPYKKVAELTQMLKKTTPKRDSLARLLPDISKKAGIYAQELLSPNPMFTKDTLQIILANLAQDSSKVAGELATLNEQVTKLSAEREGIDSTLVRYASKGFVRGDFGKSYLDSRPVATKMMDALLWTLVMNFFAIILSYLIAIPLGVQSAVWKKNSLQFFDVVSYHNLFASLIATILVAVYTKGIITPMGFWSIFLLVGLAYSGMELLLKRAYIAEKEPFLGKLWAVSYTIAMSMVLFYTWVLVFVLLLGLVFVMYLFPVATGVVVGLIAGISYLVRRNRPEKTEAEKIFDDGLGKFKLGKSGVQARGSFLDNLSTAILFILYSVPSFWIGMILLVFLTTASYGISWFPTGGIQTMAMVQKPQDYTIFARGLDILHHLVLPVFCMIYGSFSFLARQMRGSVLSVIRQDYIRTANAKGLSEDKIIWKHAFRNSLFPLITMFSSIFPRALSGSIAIELIYNIAGMGNLALSSIVARDWPVVFTIAMLAAILTMIGNLVADMLYGVADPRVTFK
jgi:ABC-type dipeptide/oligopeptide/nickel transport system permease component